MTFEEYSRKFIEKALKAGFSEDNIQACLKYAKPLIDNKLPVIYNTTNLASLVGYNKAYIKKAALFTDSYYRKFQIKKKNGKLRTIKEPLPSLKEIQTWILENILQNVKVSRYAKAYVRNRKIYDNAKYHRDKLKVLSMDVKNFFDNIKRPHVEKIFLDLNYSSNISNLLSKLCCCNDQLAQGAPTSPYISNLYMREFDEHIANFCKEKEIRYTRYADDLTFSGDFDKELIIAEVKDQLKRLDLELNTDKTLLMLKHQRQIVTGIVVNSKTIQVPRTFRDKIRQEVYYLQKFGEINHKKWTENTRMNYIKHLLGKINFVISINPEDKQMIKYKSDVTNILKNPTNQV